MKHHIVQAKYLEQWNNDSSHLHIYLIPSNKYLEKGSNWKIFWRKDYNVLDLNGGEYFIPEDVTQKIDTKSIEAIRRIDTHNMTQLSANDRSAIAYYIALQYIRTPRFREETNKLVEATVRYFMRKDITSPEKITLTKDDLLSENPKNKKEEEFLEKLKGMNEAEIKKQVFEAVYSDAVRLKLTRAGHSKQILKINDLAKDVFDCHWIILYSKKKVFNTSDNPCFTFSSSPIMGGLLSPFSTIVFPLRPDVCLYIKPRIKSNSEEFVEIDDKTTQSINNLILRNSYQCTISLDKEYLGKLTTTYNYKKHKQSKDVMVIEKGPYVLFHMK